MTHTQTPRIPALDEHSAPGQLDLIRDIRSERGGELLLLYRVLLNSPPLAEGWLKLLTAVRQQTSLDGRIRELIILQIAALNGAQYEFEAHVPFARREGVDDAVLWSIEKGEVPDSLTPRERLALRYAGQMTREIQVPDALFNELRQHYTAAEILELTVVAGAYNMVSRVLVALDIKTEH